MSSNELTTKRLAIGMRVRILMPLIDEIKDKGVIYNHYPLRRWPWHVRPDDWPGGDLGGGIAFAEEELEPLTEGKADAGE